MATKEQVFSGAVKGSAVGEGRTGTAGVVLSLLALYIIWGSTYLAIRFGLETFPPFLMAGIRYLVAGVLMYAVLRLRGHASPTRAQWRGAAIVGVLLLVGGNGLVTFAEKWVGSGFAALIVGTMPLWAALFSGLWGRWPANFEWLGLALGFGGVILLTVGNPIQASPLGAIAIFAAPICWAFGSVWSKRLPMPQGMMSSAAEMLVAGIVLFVLSLTVGERLTAAPSTISIIALLYLIVFGSILAFSAYIYLLTHVRASLATSYAYVNPAVAVGLGAWFADESVTWLTLVAMLIILSGVAVLSLVKRET